MGRRSLSTANQRNLRDRLAEKLWRLNALPGIRRGQLLAQMNEERVVQLAIDLAYSFEVPHQLRFDCLRWVYEVARPSTDPWRSAETIDPNERTPFGETVGETIDAIKVETAVFEELDSLVRRNVPYADWPAHVRALPESAMFAEQAEDDEQP